MLAMKEHLDVDLDLDRVVCVFVRVDFFFFFFFFGGGGLPCSQHSQNKKAASL